MDSEQTYLRRLAEAEALTVAERVAAGMAWLVSDEARERGFDVSRVDVDRLDMRSGEDCVLGQAIDAVGNDLHWVEVKYRAAGVRREDYEDCDSDAAYNDATVWVIAHGFYDRNKYSALQTAWIAALAPPSEQ